jgi:hypothetical protein
LTPSSHHHLSAISELELQNAENSFHHLFLHPLEVESTQTIMKSAERPGSSSGVVRGESGGQERQYQQQHIVAPHAGPGGVVDGHVVHHRSETDRLLSSVLNRSPSASAVATAAASSDVSFTQLPTIVPASVSRPNRERSSRTWSFGSGRSSLRWSVASTGSSRKVEKEEEKRRKKEEARARKKERLAEDLKKRSEAQIESRAWEEDIAAYGRLASM